MLSVRLLQAMCGGSVLADDALVIRLTKGTVITMTRVLVSLDAPIGDLVVKCRYGEDSHKKAPFELRAVCRQCKCVLLWLGIMCGFLR